MDFFDFQCYFWQRKAIAVAVGVATFTGLYLWLTISYDAAVYLASLLGAIAAIITGNLTYVLQSESFWTTPCDRCGYSKIYS